MCIHGPLLEKGAIREIRSRADTIETNANLFICNSEELVSLDEIVYFVICQSSVAQRVEAWKLHGAHETNNPRLRTFLTTKTTENAESL